MLAGSVNIGAGAAGATGCGALGLFLTTGAGVSRFSSLELQLEIPKAANSDSTTIVEVTRNGVHKDWVSAFFDFFIIAYSEIGLRGDYNRERTNWAPQEQTVNSESKQQVF
jgi:hypothetical protein